MPLTIKEGELLWKSMVKRVQASNPAQARELLIEAAKRDPTVLMAAIAQQESQGVKKAIVRNATTEALPILRLLSGLVLSHTSKGIYEQEVLGVANLLREHFGPALFVTSENARAADFAVGGCFRENPTGSRKNMVDICQAGLDHAEVRMPI